MTSDGDGRTRHNGEVVFVALVASWMIAEVGRITRLALVGSAPAGRLIDWRPVMLDAMLLDIPSERVHPLYRNAIDIVGPTLDAITTMIGGDDGLGAFRDFVDGLPQ